MSTFDNPFDPKRTLNSSGCSCGRHVSQAEHERDAIRQLQCAVLNPEYQFEYALADIVQIQRAFGQQAIAQAFEQGRGFVCGTLPGECCALALLDQPESLLQQTGVFQQLLVSVENLGLSLALCVVAQRLQLRGGSCQGLLQLLALVALVGCQFADLQHAFCQLHNMTEGRTR